jgi:hypothetical protein
MTGFESPLDLRASAPGRWLLLSPLPYVTERGIRYVVPAGFATDLASIPRLLRPLFDRNDASRAPSVLHDWLYHAQQTTRAEADSLFLEALKRSGVGFARRWAMYAGVRAGGWMYWRDNAPA